MEIFRASRQNVCIAMEGLGCGVVCSYTQCQLALGTTPGKMEVRGGAKQNQGLQKDQGLRDAADICVVTISVPSQKL